MWMWWAISRFSHYSYISLLPAVCFYWFSLFTVVTIITLQSLVGLHFLSPPPMAPLLWLSFMHTYGNGLCKCPVLCIKCSRRLSWRALHVLCDLDDWGLMMIRKLKRQILTFAGFPLIKRHLTHTSDVSGFWLHVLRSNYPLIFHQRASCFYEFALISSERWNSTWWASLISTSLASWSLLLSSCLRVLSVIWTRH